MSRRPAPSNDEDDSFLSRYPLPSTTATSTKTGRSAPTSGGAGAGSGGLAPSKSTVYVSNLDFSLTNSDLHTIFSNFGKVARVTVLKDRHSRQSRGVAFVLFVNRDNAISAAESMNGKILNGRTLRASIAADNGRAAEFIRRRVYKDKSFCYECGEAGHLSYECPNNQLGPREIPEPSKKSRRGGMGGRVWEDRGGGEEEESGDFEDDNWASVVDSRGVDERRSGNAGEKRRRDEKKEKKASYFSDESGEDE